ncbi:unnamed protein product [Amoebophrya sp. A120]|nr:unnamed protein product [Amoebophrya sp. A120]|eukprot:GSA120T00005888001.1
MGFLQQLLAPHHLPEQFDCFSHTGVGDMVSLPAPRASAVFSSAQHALTTAHPFSQARPGTTLGPRNATGGSMSSASSTSTSFLHTRNAINDASISAAYNVSRGLQEDVDPAVPTLQLGGSRRAETTMAGRASSFYAHHKAPATLPASPDDNIWNAASELQYTYGYREIKKRINAVASYAAMGCLGALGIGYITTNLLQQEAPRQKRKRADF